jgi:hypothetical protein
VTGATKRSSVAAAFNGLLVLLMLALGAAFTIVLFNRPRWVVVPHLRDRPAR